MGRDYGFGGFLYAYQIIGWCTLGIDTLTMTAPLVACYEIKKGCFGVDFERKGACFRRSAGKKIAL
jgi:hypothetical protein